MADQLAEIYENHDTSTSEEDTELIVLSEALQCKCRFYIA